MLTIVIAQGFNIFGYGSFSLTHKNVMLILGTTNYLILHNSSIKDDHLEIKFNNRIKVDDKIAWGLGVGLFMCLS